MLLWILLAPFIGGLLCWQTERFGKQLPRWIALLSVGVSLVLCIMIWWQGNFVSPVPGAGPWSAEFQAQWIPRFGISFHLAVDGLSLLMVTLAGLLGVLAVLCSWNEIGERVGFFHLNLLWILGGVIGVFLALDLFLFFFFWEMMLVPMYFLIALWGIRLLMGAPVSRLLPSSSSIPRSAVSSCWWRSWGW
jgi:NADH-quinone oxidoreductase subunit M